jgi:hypothetical protein
MSTEKGREGLRNGGDRLHHHPDRVERCLGRSGRHDNRKEISKWMNMIPMVKRQGQENDLKIHRKYKEVAAEYYEIHPIGELLHKVRGVARGGISLIWKNRCKILARRDRDL